MLSEVDNVCYICLEECDSKSPCECKMNVHPDCLSESHYHLPRKDCSICKTPITVKPFHFIPPPLMRSIQRREDSERIKYAIFYMIFFVIFYLVLGWVGKGIACTLGVTIGEDWGQFWTIEHFVAFLCTLILCTCLSNAVTQIQR